MNSIGEFLGGAFFTLIQAVTLLLPDTASFEAVLDTAASNFAAFVPIGFVGYFLDVSLMVQITIAFFGCVILYNVYLYVMQFLRKVV